MDNNLEGRELVSTSDETREISVSRDPDVVLAEAQKAAAALQKVVGAKKKKVMMNGEQYLEFEDWQLLGKFYGITAKVVSTSPVQMGEVIGFEARAAAYNVKTGEEISAADAMCLNDEDKWRSRSKYEYHYAGKDGRLYPEDPGADLIVWESNPNNPGRNRPKKEKVLVGEEAVPLFQLRSMAQTRACAKALRNVLSWVVVLAGYKPTPAEELTGQTETVPAGAAAASAQPQQQQTAKPAQQQPQGQANGGARKYDPTDAHRKLGEAILGYCSGNKDEAANMLETLTAWRDKEGREHPGKRSIGEISEKVAAIALRTFREQFEELEPGSNG